MIRLLNLIALVFLFAAPAAVLPALADTLVSLRPSVEVNSSSIRLSDVFAGVPIDLDRTIATAPAPGRSVTYDVRVLSKLAAKYRLDWRPQSQADRAVLSRAATRITQEMIAEVVLAKLKERHITEKSEVLFDNHALEINLPADRAPSFALNNFTFDEKSKRFRSELMADTGAAPLVLPVTGRIAVKRDVPVLARRLLAGTTIGPSDIDWATLPEEHVTGDVVTDSSQLVGRELRRDTPEGQPLRGRDVIPPRLVTRGGMVTLKVQTPNMVITAQGRALQDGTSGDTVRVTNTQSNRVVEGTVEGPGVVRINLTQKLASMQ